MVAWVRGLTAASRTPSAMRACVAAHLEREA